MGKPKLNLDQEEVWTVYDALQIPFREYPISAEKWVDIPLDGFNSDVGINIVEGGYRDHYNGESGGLLDLIKALKGYDRDRAREFISLAINGRLKPEIEPGQEFAKDWIAQKRGNYSMVPGPVWMDPNLTSSAKVVWIAIYDRCGKGKYCSWAGIRQLSKDTGLSTKTVNRAINELAKKGFLLEVINKKSDRAPRRYPIVSIEDS